MPTRLIPAARRTAVDDRPRLPGWVPPAPAAPPAPPGGGAIRYTHTQASPAAVWTINHNLGLYPLIQVFSPGSQAVLADVTHVSVNQATVAFKTAQGGFATCL